MSRYFSDIALGDRFASEPRTISAGDIEAFAELSGDRNRLHLDDDWVRSHTPYRGRIAHGLLVTSVTSGLPTPGIDDWEVLAFLEITRKMHAPVYPGDRIHQVFVVERLRASGSRPGSGVVTLSTHVTNDMGVLVQSGSDTLLVGGPEGGA